MIFLETARLRLRNIAPKDTAVMYDYRNNEICSRYQRGQAKDHDGIAALIRRRGEDILSADAPFMIAVALKETDEMVGEIVAKPRYDTISLGYTFSWRHHRKGYAFEALSALIDLLQERCPEWGFLCFTDPENEASMALLQKLGYQDLGYLSSMESQVFGKWFHQAARDKTAQAVMAYSSAAEQGNHPTDQERSIHADTQ